MIIKDLTQPETLSLIDSREENKRLKHSSTSPMPIFSFHLLVENTDRECSAGIDSEWIIQAIAMYRYRTATENLHSKKDYTLISIGVDKSLRGKWLGTELLDHVLTKMKQRVEIVTLQISPDDSSYRDRWTDFLHEKFRSHGLTLRNRIF